jgi:hypothetical protein
MQGRTTDIQAVNAQVKPRHMPGVNTPCYKCGSIKHWARDCPITQANLIDFNETMAYSLSQENTTQTQMMAEELKQTLYNLTP